MYGEETMLPSLAFECHRKYKERRKSVEDDPQERKTFNKQK